MKNFVIITDSACDISKEIRDEFEIKDYIPGHIHFDDGRDFETTLDWENISREEFYKDLSNKKKKITTAPASPEEYFDFFSKYAKEGYDILSISLSSKPSSTYNVACGAADRVKALYPECRIECVDSLRMSGGLGFLIIHAYELKNQGKSIDEIVAWLEENKNRVHQMGPIDDLMFVARRGRMSKGKAIMGSFAGVKPLGDCTKDGYVSVLGKVKGIKKALQVTTEYIRLAAEDINNNYVYIAHSDREEYAKTLKEMIETELKPKKIFISDVFCASGSNIGPGMVGVYFFGAPISDDMQAENNLMNSALEKC